MAVWGLVGAWVAKIFGAVIGHVIGEAFPLDPSPTESRFLERLESLESILKSIESIRDQLTQLRTDNRKEAAIAEEEIAGRMAEQLAAIERCTEVTTHETQAIRSAVLRMRNIPFVSASRSPRRRAQSLP